MSSDAILVEVGRFGQRFQRGARPVSLTIAAVIVMGLVAAAMVVMLVLVLISHL